MDVDSISGNLARELNQFFHRVESVKEFLDTKTVADLEAMGYTTDEANLLKRAFTDFATLQSIYRGEAALAVSKDFRTFIRLLWGLGI